MEKEFQFGISSWSYPWAIGVKDGPQLQKKLTAKGLVEKAHKLGVSLVQIADNLPLENLSEAELNEVRELAESFNISIEVGTKGVDVPHILRFLELAKFFGSPIVRTLPAIFGERIPIEEVEESLVEVLPAYEKAGVIITLENQEAYLVDEYVGLMQRVNHPNLKVCLDLANVLGAMEDPRYAMEKLAPYCGNYHFKDVKVIRSKTLMGFTVEGCPSGKGMIPLDRMLTLLKQYQLSASVIIELWPPPLETIEETLELEEQFVKESVEYMRMEMKK